MARKRTLISRYLEKRKYSNAVVYKNMVKVSPYVLSKATKRYSSKNSTFVGLEISYKSIKRRFNSVRAADKYTILLRKQKKFPNTTSPLYYGSRS